MANSKKSTKSSEEIMASLNGVIAKARKDGVITNSELMDTLEKLDLSVEQIEAVYETLESMFITIEGNELDLSWNRSSRWSP